MAQMVKNLPVMQENGIQSLGGEDPLEKKGNGYPLQYSCLESSVERGAWQDIVHGVTKSLTRLTQTHIRYFVECPSICLVIRLQFQISGKNTTEVM